MPRTLDPILKQANPDRLHYSTGELLGADDFRDEQTYHRRQLARALLYLHGSGSISGLRVIAQHHPGASPAQDEVHLEVQPGFALDKAGRLIEVPREACLRLRRWFNYIASVKPDSTLPDAGDLRAAFRSGVVVADIFLGFHPCDRGYTPAFASGPFDSLDASQPSRVRDGYELSLVLRGESDADLPRAFDPSSALGTLPVADRAQAAREASLNAGSPFRLVRLTTPMNAVVRRLPAAGAPFDQLRAIGIRAGSVIRTAVVGTDLQISFAGQTRTLPVADAENVVIEVPNLPPAGHVGDWHENPASVDPSAILLARLRIPAAPAVDAATAPLPDWSAATWSDDNAHVDNGVRSFLFPSSALGHLTGV